MKSCKAKPWWPLPVVHYRPRPSWKWRRRSNYVLVFRLFSSPSCFLCCCSCLFMWSSLSFYTFEGERILPQNFLIFFIPHVTSLWLFPFHSHSFSPLFHSFFHPLWHDVPAHRGKDTMYVISILMTYVKRVEGEGGRGEGWRPFPWREGMEAEKKKRRIGTVKIFTNPRSILI